MDYYEFGEKFGIEPECDNCAHFVNCKTPYCSFNYNKQTKRNENNCDGIEFFLYNGK